MGQGWAVWGCLLVHSHQAQPFLSFPHSRAGPWLCSRSGVRLVHRQQSRQTCVLYLSLSHRLEKRPCRWAANLWGTRLAQCKRLWNLHFVLENRCGRFGYILVQLWLYETAQFVGSAVKNPNFWKNCTILVWFIQNAWSISWWIFCPVAVHFGVLYIFSGERIRLIQKCSSLQFAIWNCLCKEGSCISSVTTGLERSVSGSIEHIWCYSLKKPSKYYKCG